MHTQNSLLPMPIRLTGLLQNQPIMNDNQTPTLEQMQAELDRIRNANISFIKLVGKMRDLQKEYFKTRDRQVMLQSKALEGRVDDYLKRCFDKLAQQDQEFAEKVEVVKELFDADLCPTDQQ